MLIQDITDQGITRLWTRRDRLRAAIKLILGLCGAVVCLYLGAGIASMLAGHGWHTPTITARPLFTGHGGLIGAAMLTLAAALPEALEEHGLLFAGAYVGLQVGRTPRALDAVGAFVERQGQAALRAVLARVGVRPTRPRTPLSAYCGRARRSRPRRPLR